MAVLEAALSILSFSSSSSSKPHLFSTRSKPTALCLRTPSNLSPVFSLNFPLSAGGDNSRRLVSVLCSVAEEKTEETQKLNLRKKLFVFNLPWSMSVNDISELFGQCGTVSNVEVCLFLNLHRLFFCYFELVSLKFWKFHKIIKQKDGKNRGFAFVTMASGKEAQAAVDKLDSFVSPILVPFLVKFFYQLS